MADYSKYRILVIDDESTFRTVIRKIVEKELKAEVVEASNPKEAFDLMNDEMPSLALLDMQMPVMDGASALEIIRKDEIVADLPVIIFSAVSSEVLLIRLAKLKISDYILKSSPTKLILEKIRKVLDQIENEQLPDLTTRRK